MRVAAIDIGTNTVLMLIAEARPASANVEAPIAVEDRVEITRLGRGVDRTGRLDDDALEATLAVLARYAKRARALGVTKIGAVATSATRDASNGDAFRARAAAILGGEVTVVSGAREAELTFAGALGGLGIAVDAQVAVIDVGGGSTEIIVRSAQRVWSHSYDVGSVRLTERHVAHDPPTAGELATVRDEARRAFSSPSPPSMRMGAMRMGATRMGVPLEAVVAIAGTATTYAAIDLGLVRYADAPPHGHALGVETVERLTASLASVPLEMRKLTAGLDGRRADVIVAGGLVLVEAARALGASSFVVSDRGVRWGLAAELIRSRTVNLG